VIGDPYEDRPASHAVKHATGEGPDCWCDGPPPGWHADLEIVLGIAFVFLVFLLAVMLP
jgi:hypothetical protein